MNAEAQRPTPDTLNSVMEFDHVIRVNEDGTVTDAPDVYAPSVYMPVDEDGQITDEAEADALAALRREGWELMRGYTGQYGYNGPIMHASEFIGGGMARDILDTPGDYVAVTVEVDCDYTEEFCTEDVGCSCEPAGWAVAYRPTPYDGPVTEVFSYGNEPRVTVWPTVTALELHVTAEAEHATDEETRAARRANGAALIASLRAGQPVTGGGWSDYTPTAAN